MLDAALRLLPMSLFSRNKRFFEEYDVTYTPEMDVQYRQGLKKQKLNVISLPRLLGDYTHIRMGIANIHKDKNLFKEHCDQVSQYLDVANEVTGQGFEVEASLGDPKLTIHNNSFSRLFV